VALQEYNIVAVPRGSNGAGEQAMGRFVVLEAFQGWIPAERTSQFHSQVTQMT